MTRELSEKRHKLKNKQAAQMLEAAKIMARKREEETGTR
jgi:hypothetical protein